MAAGSPTTHPNSPKTTYTEELAKLIALLKNGVVTREEGDISDLAEETLQKTALAVSSDSRSGTTADAQYQWFTQVACDIPRTHDVDFPATKEFAEHLIKQSRDVHTYAQKHFGASVTGIDDIDNYIFTMIGIKSRKVARGKAILDRMYALPEMKHVLDDLIGAKEAVTPAVQTSNFLSLLKARGLEEAISDPKGFPVPHIAKLLTKYHTEELAKSRVALYHALSYHLQERLFPHFSEYNTVEKRAKYVADVFAETDTIAFESQTDLVLRDSGIDIVPKELSKFTQLRLLNLSSNPIRVLPDIFNSFPSLQVVAMSNSFLRALPPSFTSLSMLDKLFMSNTELSTLPHDFGKLERLREVLLFKNNLKELPESIGGLKNLEKLIVCKTQLRSIPESVGLLDTLQTLELNDNKITHVPETLSNLASLRSLLLNNNEIEKLPDIFKPLRKLEELQVRKNKLTDLPESLKYRRRTLQYLEITENNFPEPYPAVLREHHFEHSQYFHIA